MPPVTWEYWEENKNMRLWENKEQKHFTTSIQENISRFSIRDAISVWTKVHEHEIHKWYVCQHESWFKRIKVKYLSSNDYSLGLFFHWQWSNKSSNLKECRNITYWNTMVSIELQQPILAGCLKEQQWPIRKCTVHIDEVATMRFWRYCHTFILSNWLNMDHWHV